MDVAILLVGSQSEWTPAEVVSRRSTTSAVRTLHVGMCVVQLLKHEVSTMSALVLSPTAMFALAVRQEREYIPREALPAAAWGVEELSRRIAPWLR